MSASSVLVFAPPVLCGNSVATCTQDRHLWIWIYPWISTQKSVDMDMDMDGKFHIHGKPENLPMDQSIILRPKCAKLRATLAQLFLISCATSCHKLSATFGFFERAQLSGGLIRKARVRTLKQD